MPRDFLSAAAKKLAGSALSLSELRQARTDDIDLPDPKTKKAPPTSPLEGLRRAGEGFKLLKDKKLVGRE